MKDAYWYNLIDQGWAFHIRFNKDDNDLYIFDLERFGMLEAFGSLRQCDILVVQGTVTRKMAPRMKWVYEQMPEPKWVISMGACASCGGVFNNYSIVQGVDRVVPVDVYVPGCPPGPEALLYGVIKLQEKIMMEAGTDKAKKRVA